MELAEPAATAPPTSVARISHGEGSPPAGQEHRRHRRDQEQQHDAGLREAVVGGDRVPEGRSFLGRGPVGVALGSRSSGSEPRCHGGERDDRGPDQDGERDVRHDGPGPQPRPHVGRTDHDLDDEQREGDGREADERRVSVGRGPCSDRRPQHEEHRDRGERPVQEHRGRGSTERRDEPAVHERPVREDELGVARTNVRPDQQEETDERRGDQGEPGERSVAPVDSAFLPCASHHAVVRHDGARHDDARGDVRHVRDQGISAATKCAVTHQASSSVATTTAPSPACASTSGNVRTAGQSGTARDGPRVSRRGR